MKYSALLIILLIQGLNSFDINLECFGDSEIVNSAKIVVNKGFDCERFYLGVHYAYVCEKTGDDIDLLMKINLTESQKQLPRTVVVNMDDDSEIIIRDVIKECAYCNATDLAQIQQQSQCSDKLMYLDDAMTKTCDKIDDFHDKPFSRVYTFDLLRIHGLKLSKHANMFVWITDRNETQCSIPITVTDDSRRK